jgi:small-conductance mechanosensitive channel
MKCRGLFFSVLLLSPAFWTPQAMADPPADGRLFERERDHVAALPPDPQDLRPDWRRYFDVAPDKLNERIEGASQSLKAFLRTLPEEERTEAQARIERILENLRALSELRQSLGPEPLASRPAKEAYTLDGWLEVAHKRRAVQTELQSESENLLRDEKRANAAGRRLDSQTAAYLALSNQSPEKAARGLALMAAWSELAVNGERSRLQRAALTARKAHLAQLVQENALAAERLHIDADGIARLKLEIEAARRELAASRESLSELETDSATGKLDTDEDKAKTLLSEQSIRHGAVKEAIAEAILTRKRVELDLANLLTAPDDIELDGFAKRLRDNAERIAEIGARLEVWREEAEREQGRAGASLTALFGSAARQSGELVGLTQRRLDEAQDTLLSLQRLDGEIHDAELIAERMRASIAAREGALKSGLETVKTSSVKLWALFWERLETSLFKIGETPVTTLGILRVLLILALAWALSHSVRRGLTHLSESQRGSSAFLYTLGRLAHYLILILGVSVGLSSIGVDFTNFAMIAGALSLGIGFGLQAIVSNFVSGLIVLFERSLRVGDFVELSSGVAGEVRAVNVRSTLVTTPDMVDILVPNSEFVNGKVINWTLTDASRRIHIPFGVAYGSDKETVRRAALEAAESTPYTLTERRGREPQAWLVNFGDSSLDFELVVWVRPAAVKKPQMVRAAYYWELETALRKYGIEIPFPQRDIHVRGESAKLPAENATVSSEANAQPSPTKTPAP